MNERIRELAEQALNEYSATYHNEAKIPEAYLKKFAELIVGECGVALSPMLREMVSRGHAYELIRQHFGDN